MARSCVASIALIALIASTAVATSRADETESPKRAHGAIVAVENVVLEPDAAHATRVRILGAFAIYSSVTESYGPSQVGYMYFTCPEGHEAECRAQWQTISASARTFHCVGLGWDAPPGRVRPPAEEKTEPDAYLLLNGTDEVEDDEVQCAALLTARRTAYPPPARVIRIEPDRRPTAPAKLETKWYGGQTLLTDGLSWTLFIAGADRGSSSLALLGFGGILLGAPIVHWSHGHSGRGFGSLVLRLGSTVLLIYGLASTFEGSDSVDRSSSRSTGHALATLGVLGLLAAPAIDAAALAYDEVPTNDHSSKAPAHIGAAPWFGKNAFGVALSGVF